MSIIVVVRKGGQAAIAADTLQSDDSLMLRAHHVRNHKKIMQLDENYLGLAGWAASQDIMESVIRNHKAQLDFSDRSTIFETMRRLHSIIKTDYHVDTNEEKDQPVESSQLSMLVANPQGIFEVDSYRTVSEYEKFWALGSGRNIALGAMHTLYDRLDSAAEIASGGVDAACEFDDGCALPANVFTISLK
ncbi:MAG: MFS transporter [Gammaproteobacteria bacterium]|nr:MFS transporter [Gammaproteobacteria bacterium]NNF67504.1 MFS transporter [Gammaproteobacteria bacterium]